MGHEDNEQELREGCEEWKGGEGVGVNVGARRGGGRERPDGGRRTRPDGGRRTR